MPSYNKPLKLDDVCPTEAHSIDAVGNVLKFPRVYTDTPTGEPITLTEEDFNNLVELFRGLVKVRDRNKTPK